MDILLAIKIATIALKDSSTVCGGSDGSVGTYRGQAGQ